MPIPWKSVYRKRLLLQLLAQLWEQTFFLEFRINIKRATASLPSSWLLPSIVNLLSHPQTPVSDPSHPVHPDPPPHITWQHGIHITESKYRAIIFFMERLHNGCKLFCIPRSHQIMIRAALPPEVGVAHSKHLFLFRMLQNRPGNWRLLLSQKHAFYRYCLENHGRSYRCDYLPRIYNGWISGIQQSEVSESTDRSV